MIRPYLTVIKDSFNEAFSSRVLWILLLVLTLVLLALAPLCFTDKRATRLEPSDIRDWQEFAQRLDASDKDKATPLTTHLWETCGKDYQKAVSATQEDTADDEDRREQWHKRRRQHEKIISSINSGFEKNDFYQAAAWDGVSLNDELKERTAGIKDLSGEDLEALNRLLFVEGFRRYLRVSGENVLHVKYLGWEVPLPVTREVANSSIVEPVLTLFMDTLLGAAGILISILVTASIIPQTFEAGAIDLLLSKPVSRPLLFLVKFAGGCAFTLINAAYLIAGLWLIVGLRFGIWNQNLLLCIPVFIFTFAIYYSVSAAAAVRWKNAIVCVIITLLFWLCCFGLWGAKTALEIAIFPEAVVRLVPTDDGLLAVRLNGETAEWQGGSWESIGQGRARGPENQVYGAVFQEKDRRIVMLQQPPAAMKQFGFAPTGASLATATWDGNNWKQQALPTPPPGTSWIFIDAEQNPLIVAKAGVYSFDPAKKASGGLLGFQLPFGQKGPYALISPENELELSERFAAAYHGGSGDLLLADEEKIYRLKTDDEGKYSVAKQVEVEDIEFPVLLTTTDSQVVAADSAGEMHFFDRSTLEHQKTITTGKCEPYELAATSDGKHIAVLHHDGKLVTVATENQRQKHLASDVTAIAFDQDNYLCYSKYVDVVTTYDIAAGRQVDRLQPESTIVKNIYFYFLKPFYTIFPKPGELNKLVAYFVKSGKSEGEANKMDLRELREVPNVFGPIWNSVAFMFIVLGSTCFYVWRMDF